MAETGEQRGPERSVTPMGQYYLLDKIAQGGMAEIYKGLAYDLHGIKKTVVIKKILPQISADPEFVQMLINEAKIAVQLTHGNIAQIYDLGKVGEDYFMVMEYVDGKSLSQIHRRNLKQGTLIPIDYVCYFISEVASGLNYMHRRSDDRGRNLGIVHRDISPQNVIISYSGTVKIIDFGIAKAAIQINITDSGVLKGKFAYMSPEQAKGEPIDNQSDIFSLGVILYEILTGKRLFKAKDKRQTLKNVRRADVQPPSSVRPDLPPEIDKIVMKALAKDPNKRYMWASELHDDLVKFLHTRYPDFQPASVTGYIRKLFKDEVDEREDMDEEAKTPFLIIDHTQSALMQEKMEITGVTRIPPQLSEFMLDDETPLPEKKVEVEVEAGPEVEGETKRRVSFKTIKDWKTVSIVVASLTLIFFAIFTIGIDRGWMKPPSFISFLLPSTRLTIDVEPPDAEVVFGDTQLKDGPHFVLKDIRPETNYRLIVEKDGYLPYFHSVSLNRGERKKLKVVLKPEPPHFATLTLTSEPPGATVFLNEKKTNLVTPATVRELSPNTYHSIGLFLGDHEFWSRDIRLSPDEEKSIHATLSISHGELQIISTPEDADVFIDGRLVGKTPFIKTGLSPNEVMEIVVSKNGFTTWSSKAKVKAGAPLIFMPKLSRTKELMVPHFLRDLDRPPSTEPAAPKTSDDLLPAAPPDSTK